MPSGDTGKLLPRTAWNLLCLHAADDSPLDEHEWGALEECGLASHGQLDEEWATLAVAYVEAPISTRVLVGSGADTLDSTLAIAQMNVLSTLEPGHDQARVQVSPDPLELFVSTLPPVASAQAPARGTVDGKAVLFVMSEDDKRILAAATKEGTEVTDPAVIDQLSPEAADLIAAMAGQVMFETTVASTPPIIWRSWYLCSEHLLYRWRMDDEANPWESVGFGDIAASFLWQLTGAREALLA